MNQRVVPAVFRLELGIVRRPRPGMGAHRGLEAGINQSWWRWARPLGGALILGGLVAALGGGAFLDAFRAMDPGILAVGSAVAAATTVCAAWRWRLVARRLHVELAMASAVTACYRAQFLNVALPGGMLGDVERGVHHGREVGDIGRGLRAVAWERTAGQVVLLVATAAALLVGRPFSWPTLLMPVGGLAVAGGVALGVARAASSSRAGVSGRIARVAAGDARGLLAPSALLGIALASLAVLAGHVATFVLAARTVGVQMPAAELVPLALLVLLLAAVPLNVAGWGPREGAAAWAFAAAGTGATQGLAVALAYGAIVFVATLPGAVLVLIGRSRWSSPRSPRSSGRREPPRAPRRGRGTGGDPAWLTPPTRC